MAVVNTNLDLQFEICEPSHCRWLEFTETTGTYNSVTNPGGWDSTRVDNPYFNDGGGDPLLTLCTLTITDPNGVNYMLGTVSVPFWREDTGEFPDTTGTKVYIITADLIGLTSSDKIPDGLYTFRYDVAGAFGANTYTAYKTCQILITCQANCCIQKMFKSANVLDCIDCKNDRLRIAMLTKRKLEAAKMAAVCGKPNKASTILSDVQWVCNNYNCSNC